MLSYVMATWVVLKYVKSGGRCPIDQWRNSNELTNNDRALLDARVDDTERIEGPLPPERVKKYKTSSVSEFKVRGDKKQLRPLCVKLDGMRIVLLCGAIEKNYRIPHGNIETAENLLKSLKDGNGHCKSYYED